jgi:2-isopropylmalate synthase
MTKPVQLLDSTLREGEQRVGVRFGAEAKLYILGLLEQFGVDLIEVGHPGISAEDEAVCTRVAAGAKHAEVLMHARADLREVHAAERAGADWVGIWGSINAVATAAKFVNRNEIDIHEKVRVAIAEAKQLGLRVRFTIEDASRTDWEPLSSLAEVALRAGADRISLADTVGVLEPVATTSLFMRARQQWGCELAGHFHDDLGLAQANALAAIDAGAAVIDVSICGIGERAGITDLLRLTTALRRLRGIDRYHLSMMPELVHVVMQTTGYRPDDQRPVIGNNAFTHASRYHVEATKRLASAYEAFPPQWVGRRAQLHEERPPLDTVHFDAAAFAFRPPTSSA